ncbi:MULTISPECIES: AAA family ATPase [Aminobacterium]|uniref:AAA family ATPase n=1 Tax=Aminobacterium TaxID=81466 RepID=UPI00257B2B9F|nr:AAA family ATPase [Aminobacterium sp. UBA4834]
MLSLREIGLSADDIRSWFEREFHPKNARIDGDQIYCSCPIQSHGHKNGDKSPSFSFNCEQGVWTCHSSGDSGSIKKLCELCGVPTPWNGKGKIPARQTIYTYENADGQPLYEVVRLDDVNGKKIFQRAISPDGKRVNSMRGIERIPYRLPELIQAQKSNQPIFVVEGEKCAETLRSLGLTATTNSGGAGKWNDCGKYFQKGINIIVIPDNDQPGRRHGLEVATDLKQRGCNVKILNLPGLQQKEDVVDWLGVGHSKEELLNLVGQEQEWDEERAEAETAKEEEKILSIFKSIDELPREKTEMIAGLFPRRGLSIFAAPSGCFKSLIVQRIASELSTGSKVLGGIGGATHPQRVVLFNGEMDQTLLWERKQIFNFQDDPNFFHVVDKKTVFDEAKVILDVDIPEGRRAIGQCIDIYARRKGAPDLIIFDSISSFAGGANLNDRKEIAPIVEFLVNLSKKHNAAVLIIHHLKKRKVEERGAWVDQDDVIGGYWLMGAASYGYAINERRDKETGELTERIVTNVKSRSKPKPPFAFSVEEKEDGSSEFSINLTPSLGDSKKENVWNKINRVFGDGGTFKREAVERLCPEISESYIRKLLKEWVEVGALEKEGVTKDTKYRLSNIPREGVNHWSNPPQTLMNTTKHLTTPIGQIVVKSNKPTSMGLKSHLTTNPNDLTNATGQIKSGVCKGSTLICTMNPPLWSNEKSEWSNDLETNVNDSLTKAQPVEKCTSLNKFLSSIQEKKGGDSVENLNQPKVTDQTKMSKPDQRPIQNSPPADWAAWLESSEPEVKEKYNEVFNRLSKFISPEQAIEKAYQRAWGFQQKLKEEAA